MVTQIMPRDSGYINQSKNNNNRQTGIYSSPIGSFQSAQSRQRPIAGPAAPAAPTAPAADTFDEEAIANQVFNAIKDTLGSPTVTTPSSGGGAAARQYAAAQNAIQSLQGQMAGPSQYQGLNTQLSQIYSDAEKRIREAGSGLGTYLTTPTGYTPQLTQAMSAPSVAMSNYLNAIGASGQDVNAQRALTDAALQRIAASTAGYSGALTQSSQDIRNALAGAVPANVTAGLTNAALQRAAMEAAIAQAQFKERQGLQNQILDLAIKYGVKL